MTLPPLKQHLLFLLLVGALLSVAFGSPMKGQKKWLRQRESLQIAQQEKDADADLDADAADAVARQSQISGQQFLDVCRNEFMGGDGFISQDDFANVAVLLCDTFIANETVTDSLLCPVENRFSSFPHKLQLLFLSVVCRAALPLPIECWDRTHQMGDEFFQMGGEFGFNSTNATSSIGNEVVENLCNSLFPIVFGKCILKCELFPSNELSLTDADYLFIYFFHPL
jgi:hypothetical protein